MNRISAVVLVAFVSMFVIIGGMAYSIYDLETSSNFKILELEYEIKSLENKLIIFNATNTELEKINNELLVIPNYLRNDYQKLASEKFLTAEAFLNDKTGVLIPVIFTAAIKGEIKDNSSFTVYGQVPYADSVITGTIFRGDLNNAAIIDIFQVTSNEYGQYSHDIGIDSEQLWRVGNYTISIQNDDVFKELIFAYK